MDREQGGHGNADDDAGTQPTGSSQSIEWYHDGQSRLVSVNGIDVVIRYVGSKSRKARIAIEAPAGASFRSLEPKRANQ